ncbi:MAG: cellulose binding domain-containing protein [Polyangiaceae bacterium]
MNSLLIYKSRFLTFFALAVLAQACADVEGESTVSASSSSALVSAGGLDASFIGNASWNSGYCGEVVLKNNHASSSVTNWSVKLDMGTGTIQNAWSATQSGSTGIVTFKPVDYNSRINPGATVRFGFCASIPVPGTATANVVEVTDDLPVGNCVEHELGAVPTRVQIRVADVDDYVYLTINGIRRRVWHYYGEGQNELIDITPWFANGNNEVRIQAMNGGGPADYSVELYVDGQAIANEVCPESLCNSSNNLSSGIWLDRTYNVPLSNLPFAQTVTLTSATPGALYVNGQYTGKRTPTSLSLPPGQYTFGLGLSNDTPGSYTGEFREETVSVGVCPKTVDLTSHSALPVLNTTRIGILPVRTAVHGDPTDLGVLANSDIPYLAEQMNAIRDAWVEPFSYGLTTWSVESLPVVENVALQRGPDCMDPPQTGLLLEQAGLTGLRDQYDILVFLYSSHRADGTDVAHVPCAIWAGGQEISYYSGWLRSVPPGEPSEGLFHESLHSYEWYNGWRRGYYGGVDGLHGAEEHGYKPNQNGHSGWLDWYRAFARNQAPELVTMRQGVEWPSVPTTSDLYVGVFDSMRYGIGATPSAVTTTAPSAKRSALVRSSGMASTVVQAKSIPAEMHVDAAADLAK